MSRPKEGFWEALNEMLSNLSPQEQADAWYELRALTSENGYDINGIQPASLDPLRPPPPNQFEKSYADIQSGYQLNNSPFIITNLNFAQNPDGTLPFDPPNISQAQWQSLTGSDDKITSVSLRSITIKNTGTGFLLERMSPNKITSSSAIIPSLGASTGITQVDTPYIYQIDADPTPQLFKEGEFVEASFNQITITMPCLGRSDFRLPMKFTVFSKTRKRGDQYARKSFNSDPTVYPSYGIGDMNPMGYVPFSINNQLSRDVALNNGGLGYFDLIENITNGDVPGFLTEFVYMVNFGANVNSINRYMLEVWSKNILAGNAYAYNYTVSQGFLGTSAATCAYGSTPIAEKKRFTLGPYSKLRMRAESNQVAGVWFAIGGYIYSGLTFNNISSVFNPNAGVPGQPFPQDPYNAKGQAF